MCKYKIISEILLLKPWNQIPIIDNTEPLISIEKYFKFIDPHPYYKLGAPYKNKNRIWSLRKGVVDKLINANKLLKIINKNYSLIIYDAWRPIEVQSFMFNRALENELNRKGLNISKDKINNHPEVLKKVEKFWAYPNLNNRYPPPHSTGAAVDLTIIDGSGDLIDMGCEIDNLDGKSVPIFIKIVLQKMECFGILGVIYLRMLCVILGFPSIQMNGGILVMVINYGHGKMILKKQFTAEFN